jgi:outer membrane protein OmpA-like peptidoglycan-associated protein
MRSPLVVYQVADGHRLGALVSDRVGASLVGSIGLYDWVELGLELPLVLYQMRPEDIPGVLTPGARLTPLSGTNIGDVRVVAKVRLLRQRDAGVSVALIPALSAPTGGAHDYFGEKGVVFSPELALSREQGRFRFGFNLGTALRQRTVSLNQVVESELTGHFGAGYRFEDAEHPGLPLELDLSLSTAVSATAPFASSNQTHLELRAMAAYDVTPGLQLLLGGGAGLMHGWGTPDFRAFAGVRFAESMKAVVPPPPADRDHDALVDTADRCPDQPETMNGFEDGDGCPDTPPDPDPDRDGIAGAADRCPQRSGPARNLGCPEFDLDKDGVVNVDDACPAVPGLAALKGCPDPDKDDDGVLDADDKCPGEPGPADNRGCPDLDRDGDGLVDRLDNCPGEKGKPENRGCAVKQLVVITQTRLEILDSVQFKTKTPIIERRSFRLLDNVAAVLAAHPELTKILIECHTDDQGKPVENLSLSERRAKAVAAYLVKKGISAERLIPRGFGQTQPIASNKTAMGRAENRRLVFTILSSGDATVQEAAPTTDVNKLELTPAQGKSSPAKKKPGKGGSR